MSKTTTVNALPYPEDTDTPDGPAQFKALADALDVLRWGSRNLKPTAGEKIVAADFTLATGVGAKEITGSKIEITPAVDSKLFVDAAFAWQYVGGSHLSLATYLEHVGVNQEQIGRTQGPEARMPEYGVTAGQAMFELPAGVKASIILMAAKLGVGIGEEAKILKELTRYTYVLVAA